MQGRCFICTCSYF